MPPALPLLGAVLAGGRSSRMGTDKSQLRLPSGQRLLDRALDALRPLTVARVVSGRSPSSAKLPPAEPPTAEPGTQEITYLPDPVAHRGPAIGIAVVLAEAQRRECQGALVLPVDQPALTDRDLAPLVAAWRAHPEQITAGTFDGQHLEPLIAIYPIGCRRLIETLAASEDRSLSRLLARTPTRRVRLRSAAATHVNTPADWSAFHAR